MSFNKLGLRAELLKAVQELGYKRPTPIQAKSISVILKGSDILAGAQTGTGKTAAFTLPILDQLSKSPKREKNPRALILTPTRELASQVGESVAAYGKNLNLLSTVIFGGVSIKPQIGALRRGTDILVATPGRLLDHANQGNVNFSNIKILVLDEADRMLDMGFIHDIRRIIKLLPEKRQNLMFSATYSREIKKLASCILVNPRLIEVSKENIAAGSVKQKVHHIPRNQKRELLSHMINKDGWQQVLVFTRTKHGANKLTRQLTSDGVSALAIHGNKSQSARTKALQAFKKGSVCALVATDVAARGLDIASLPYVVNFDLPDVPEDYVHRIGRTGRAGAEGIAVSLVSAEEKKQLNNIQRLISKKIPVDSMDDFSPANGDHLKKASKPAKKRIQKKNLRSIAKPSSVGTRKSSKGRSCKQAKKKFNEAASAR